MEIGEEGDRMSDLMSNKAEMDKLHEAKLELIGLIWSNAESKLWTLVQLVDQYQQKAIDAGIWKLPKEPKEVRKSKVLPFDAAEGELCWDESRGVGMEMRNGEWIDVSADYWLRLHGGEGR